MARDEEDIVDISEPINFALFYILFRELAREFGLPNDPNKWKPDRFGKKLGNQVDAKNLKSIISKLQGKFDIASYSSIYRFELKNTVKSLCTPLKNEKNKYYTSWDGFKSDNAQEANELLKERGDFFHSFQGYLQKEHANPTNSIKIYIGLVPIGIFDDAEKIHDRIVNGLLEKRLISQFEAEDVQLNIQKGKELLNAYQAKTIAKKKNADLIIYGVVDSDRDKLRMNISYLVADNKLQERLRDNQSGFRVSGSTGLKLEETSTARLWAGHLQADIDQTMFLILALKFYLEFKVDRALEYLENIPTEERCDEAWFMTGVCQFDKGDYDTAGASWNKTLEKNPSHQKARINLAVLKEREYRTVEGKTIKDQVREDIFDLLAEELYGDSPSEIKFKMAHIYDLIGEKEMAKKYYELVIHDDGFGGRAGAYLLLAILTEEIEYIKNTAILAGDTETHEQCIRWISKSNRMDIADKKSLLEDIRSHISIELENKEVIEGMYINKIAELSIPDGKMIVKEIKGGVRKADESNKKIEKGYLLDAKEVLVAEGGEAVMSVLYKYKNSVEIMGLKLAEKGEPEFVDLCRYSYLSILRDGFSDRRRLFLHSLAITDRVREEVQTVRIRQESDVIYLDIDRQRDVGFLLEKSLLRGWYQEGEKAVLTLHIQYQKSPGNFETLESMELMIVDDLDLKGRVREFSQYLNCQTDEEYFLAIANYLTDFYAYTDKDDVKRWLTGQLL
jgi:tetratricopeptide (TPR) repeat protein